ncbi:phosphotransferase [Arthrobacter sp. AL12]|uniref:phosphotransferase n=1 Tax=Arthrobacter sp. AL12 TaxID=3042241 RepID=UPI00249B697C|nr:phosphotransferase [Arthrobacter sp. AL12]MDI3212504.1 phosphotransferase [Arthrobacter sp. AL12]
MRRQPIELAAVATAAVPGLTPTAVSSAPDDPADFDSALLLDSEGKRWRVRSPRHAEASARLETEFLVLRAFLPGIRAELPFLMPTVAGTVRQGPLTTFVYSHLAGSTRSVEELGAASPAVAREIGAALAAIHDLPHALVSNADLPSYTPNEFRQRRLNELDQAATTGMIPPLLLRRWEHALEDVSLWRFNPCVVHGDLHEDNLLVGGDRVTAVTGWTDLRIGDPADDMAWLVASNDQDFVDAVLAHYTSSRRDVPDAHLLRRAALSAEFALAQYLVKGIAAGNQDMIDEAKSMLTALAEDVAEHGGQPISVEPLPQPTPASDQAPQAPAEGGAPVPAVSKVTLLAPDSVSGLPAVPSSTAMPAVHVAPIPLAAGGEGSAPGDAGVVDDSRAGVASEAAPHKVSGGVSVTAIPDDGPAADESSAEDTSTQSIAVVQAAAPAPEQAQALAGTMEPPEAPGTPAEDTSTTALTVVEAKSR